jgi:gamma-glutamylcyclotransferase (GGCT)/AIG2-like uncharacterized protein YtfP
VTPAPTYYFAFGMNMVDRYMDSYEATDPRAAWLDGWELHYRQYADVVPTADPGATVPGVVWTVTDVTMAVLDSREGVPVLYERFLLPVRLADGSVVSAWVYVMTPRTVAHYVEQGPFTTDSYVSLMVEGRESVGHPTDDLPERSTA